MSANSICKTLTAFVLLNLIVFSRSARTQEIPIEIPAGFKVEHFANDDLATNIYSMTLNANGELVVAGPGYIKTLLDRDGDGQADEAILYSNLPKQGAQGLFFEDDRLYATGDGGLLVFEDQNGDRVADGPPRTLMKIKTGGEHDAHAIRRGPDGWLYVLCGNGVPIKPEYHNGKNSPVKEPRAGFLMRISPDQRTREIYCHGFRNAYDFDFDMIGNVFVYDSDGERDVSMPWYQPTRVYYARPGDDAGFVSPSFKRPDYFEGMPQVAARLGRGSPTGVVCYRHRQFPTKYQNAAFVLDWTFGRVIAVRETESGKFEHELFASGKDFFGFAPTDCEVAPDGSLYVSVGGRGTRGGVYRISYPKNHGLKPAPGMFTDQPLSSWALKQKSASQNKLSEKQIIKIAFDPSENVADRIAALDYLVRHLDVLESKFDPIHLIEHRIPTKLVVRIINLSLQFPSKIEPAKVLNAIVNQNIKSMLIWKELKRMRFGPNDKVDDLKLSEFLKKNHESLRFLSDESGLDAILDQQHEFGFSSKPSRPVFASYESNEKAVIVVTLDDIEDLETRLNPSKSIEFFEAARLSALSAPFREKHENVAVANRLLNSLQSDSDPIQDIHVLACLAVINPDLEEKSIDVMANALVNIVPKINKRKLARDRNWPRHMRDIAERLLKNHPTLKQKLVTHDQFANPQNEFMFFAADGVYQEGLTSKLARWAKNNKDSDLLTPRLLGRIREFVANDPEFFAELWKRNELRASLLQAISRKPSETQIDYFIWGLESANGSIAKRSATAILKIAPEQKGQIVVPAVKNLLRYGWDRNDQPTREQMIHLLRQQTGKTFGFVMGERGRIAQSDVIKKWQDLAKNVYPKIYASFFTDANVEQWTFDTLKKVDWSQGKAERGLKLYRSLSCSKCHDGARSVGPTLGGITKRFSREDLFKTITQPDEQVSSRYRTVLIETTNGETHKGVVIYESVDGLILSNGENETIRIENSEIEFRETVSSSIMPAGLLEKTTPADWADLYEYLKTIR